MNSLIKEDDRMVVFSPSVSSPEDEIDGPIKKTSVGSTLPDWMKKKTSDRKKELDLLLQDYEAYTYKQVQAATDRFAPVRLVHKDDLHDLYNGHFRAEETDALIKRLKHQKKLDVDDLFSVELRALRIARHPNIIKAIGLCREGKYRLVILESMPQGSLYSYLHSQDRLLPWVVRYKISLGLALALRCLHDEHAILHRNIKSHNILFASDSNAKLASFMLAKFGDYGTEVQKIALLEIPKQIKPECIREGVVTKAFDVYSFGTVLLEIATGLRPSEIVKKLCSVSNSSKIKEVHDKRLNGEFDKKQMDRLIVAGLRCASPYSQPRPSLKQVYDYLETGNPDLSIPPSNVTCYPQSISSTKKMISTCNEDHANSSPSQLQELTSIDDVRNGTRPITRKGKEVISECPPRSEFMVEQPIVDLESIPGHSFDIGIPPDYNSTGPLKVHHHQIMEGFARTLRDKLESGVQFKEVMKIIRKFTSILVMMDVPLEKWKLDAQDILQKVEEIEYVGVIYRENPASTEDIIIFAYKNRRR